MITKRTPKPPKPTRQRLALREIHGHVTIAKTGAMAWYVLDLQRWSFTTDAQREALIVAFGSRLASMTGKTPHERVSTRPYPVQEWARALDEASPNPLKGWAEHSQAAQVALSKSGLSDKIVYYGIPLDVQTSLLHKVFGGDEGSRWKILRDGTAEMTRLNNIVGEVGMGGRPADTTEIEWLMHRSVRLGLPAPTRLSPINDDWTGDDILTFTDGVTWDPVPAPGNPSLVPMTKVTADYHGNAHSRYVAVLTFGRMPVLKIPDGLRGKEPWRQAIDRFPFPIEVSSRYRIVPGHEVAKRVGRRRLAVRDMQQQYDEHGIEQPIALERKAAHSKRVEDEATEGSPVVATRAYGWYRLAVSAPTYEQCQERAQAVIDYFRDEQRMEVRWPQKVSDSATQIDLLKEFTPGERLATTAYRRELPILYVAAGLPHVSASIGDRRGPYMGYTAGAARRGFTFDPHMAPEVYETSGLIVTIGKQGAGKSALVGKMVYESAMRDITTTVFDPSGPLANLCKMERLRNHSRHLDLVDGDDGILNPYAVIPTPLRDNFDSDRDFDKAFKVAQASRKRLASDVIWNLIPKSIGSLPQTRMAIASAIRAVGGEPTASLWDVVKELDKQKKGSGVEVGRYLRDMAEMPEARLFYPNTLRDTGHIVNDTLLVLTMSGLELPSTNDRDDWGTAEQLSVPLLHLATHYATARAYGMARNERKMVAWDEAGWIGKWGSGKNLVTRLGTDSRKWDLAVLIAGQNPDHILDMNVANHVSTAFVGRIEDEDTARAALRLLRIKENAGYEAVIQGLSGRTAFADGRKRGPREFIVRDPLLNVEKVVIDFSHQPELLAALNTTPDAMARAAAATMGMPEEGAA